MLPAPCGSATRWAAWSRSAPRCCVPRRSAASSSPRRPASARRPALAQVTLDRARRRPAGAPDRAVPARVGALSARPAGSRSAGGAWRIPTRSTRARRGVPRRARAPRRHAPGRPGPARLDDPRTELDRVTCPCLCLWGASDNWVRVEDGIEYARRLRAPLRTIAGCGHLLIGERPDACLAAIREFVAGARVRPLRAPRTGSPPRLPPPGRAEARRRGTRPAGRRPRPRCAACPRPPTTGT